MGNRVKDCPPSLSSNAFIISITLYIFSLSLSRLVVSARCVYIYIYTVTSSFLSHFRFSLHEARIMERQSNVSPNLKCNLESHCSFPPVSRHRRRFERAREILELFLSPSTHVFELRELSSQRVERAFCKIYAIRRAKRVAQLARARARVLINLLEPLLGLNARTRAVARYIRYTSSPTARP